MHPIVLPLLADLSQIIGTIVGLAFLVMWIIKQIGEAKKQMGRPQGQPAAQQRQPQPRPQVPPAPAQAGQAAQAGQQADPLRDQVQEFLRRAQQQPRPEQPRAAQRRPKRGAGNAIEVLVPEELASEERRSLSEPFRPMHEQLSPQTSTASRQASAPRKTVESPRTTVAEHVTDHIGAGSRSGWQASKLGQRIITDDAQFDVQLNAKFDHTVGTLAASRVSESGSAVSPANDSPAGQIAALLASPGGVRQAMVLNEILVRPSDRW